jgi:hypothetical protein
MAVDLEPPQELARTDRGTHTNIKKDGEVGSPRIARQMPVSVDWLHVARAFPQCSRSMGNYLVT